MLRPPYKYLLVVVGRVLGVTKELGNGGGGGKDGEYGGGWGEVIGNVEWRKLSGLAVRNSIAIGGCRM